MLAITEFSLTMLLLLKMHILTQWSSTLIVITEGCQTLIAITELSLTILLVIERSLIMLLITEWSLTNIGKNRVNLLML